jgi:hypothetical protein
LHLNTRGSHAVDEVAVLSVQGPYKKDASVFVTRMKAISDRISTVSKNKTFIIQPLEQESESHPLLWRMNLARSPQSSMRLSRQKAFLRFSAPLLTTVIHQGVL